ncbi:MAG: prepilin peptidase [Fusobacteriaceae bacterium]
MVWKMNLEFLSEYFFKTIFFGLLILISIIDLKKMEIPNLLTLSLLFTGLVYNFFKEQEIQSMIGMAIYALPFSLIYGYVSEIYKKEVIGYGDIKLVMGIGGFLTYSSMEKVYLFFTLTFLLASFYAIFLFLKFRKKDMLFPLGPFICASAVIIFLLGEIK